MSNRHPPPTEANKKSGPDVSPSRAADSANNKNQPMRICLAHCQYTRTLPVDQHLPPAQLAFDLAAPPGDARHALILFELLRLDEEQAGDYQPGPRFGDGQHKPGAIYGT